MDAEAIECPYVGLEPFESKHADYFFGRRRDSKVLADHVIARPVTVLYGPSGIGKSSIVNVGLPAALPDSPGWTIAGIEEWQDPERLEPMAVEAVLKAIKHRAIRTPERIDFAALVGWVVRKTGRPLLLILDQFEEYFLYRDRDRMRPLETAIGGLLARRDLPFHVLIALRDDALHQLDQLRAFVPSILDTTIELGPLNNSAVKEAILEPIARYNERFRRADDVIRVEDKLVTTLINQLKEAETSVGLSRAAPDGQRIELPYLQIALMKLWAAEGGATATVLRESTLVDERKLGGVKRIVRDHVTSVMNKLAPNEQDLCARIFDRLVTGIGSKIAYPTEALAAPDVVGVGVSQDHIKAILGKLTPHDARIVKPVTTNGLPGFVIFHDVLGLPVLDWKRAYQADLLRKRQLAEAEQQRTQAAVEAKREEESLAWQFKYELEKAQSDLKLEQRRRIRAYMVAVVFAAMAVIVPALFDRAYVMAAGFAVIAVIAPALVYWRYKA